MITQITQHSYSTTQIEEINRSVLNNAAGFVEACEARYQDQINAAAERVAGDIRSNQVVLLSGPTASAKTSTAGKIREGLERKGITVAVVSLDDFYLDRKNIPLLPNGKRDLENVTALDLPLMESCFATLQRTGSAVFPLYDFTKSQRSAHTHLVDITQGKVLIIEGIHALNPAVAGSMDAGRILKLYVSVRTKFMLGEGPGLIPKCARLIRRIVRDQYFRNTSPEVTLSQWDSVCAGERMYINPYRDSADIKIDSTMAYEPCVFHHFLKPLAERIDPDTPHFQQLRQILGSLDLFAGLPREVIPAESILREFVGDHAELGEGA